MQSIRSFSSNLPFPISLCWSGGSYLMQPHRLASDIL